MRPGSSLSHQLGFYDAPTRDTSDPFNHGQGADALAFRFNRAGILSAPPAYIVQAIPNKFYTQRLGSFIRGQSKLADVKVFFWPTPEYPTPARRFHRLLRDPGFQPV